MTSFSEIDLVPVAESLLFENQDSGVTEERSAPSEEIPMSPSEESPKEEEQNKLPRSSSVLSVSSSSSSDEDPTRYYAGIWGGRTHVFATVSASNSTVRPSEVGSVGLIYPCAAESPVHPSAESQEGSWKDLQTPSDGPARRASAFSQRRGVPVAKGPKCHENPKNHLQELCQKNRMPFPTYHCGMLRNGKSCSFVEVVTPKGDILRSDSFSGCEKKQTEQKAAADMIVRLKYYLLENPTPSFGVEPVPLPSSPSPVQPTTRVALPKCIGESVSFTIFPTFPSPPRVAIVFYKVANTLSAETRGKINEITVVLKKTTRGTVDSVCEDEGAKIFETKKPATFLICVLFKALQNNDKVFLISEGKTRATFLDQALLVDPTLKARFTQLPNASAVEMLF